MVLTVSGMASRKCLTEKGRKRCTVTTPDLFALGDEVQGGLAGGFRTGAHDDDDALGIRGAGVVEELVLAAGQAGELVHLGLHDVGHGVVEAVAGLAGLEEAVGVLGGAADRRGVRAHGAGAVGADGVVVDHGGDRLVGELGDLLDLVGGPEAVEGVDEGDAGLEGGGVGDEGEVHALLDVAREELGPAGLPDRHDVAVVAEDREGVGRDASGPRRARRSR